MSKTPSKDGIGQRGEALFFSILTKRYGRMDPLFKPQFLGDKWPTVDFIVELIGHSCHVVPFFFVQVKATQQPLTKKLGRLRVQVSSVDLQRLAAFPAPTYLVGIDEVLEQAFIASVHGKPKRSITSLTTSYQINKQIQDDLFKEVESFWRTSGVERISSIFTDSQWS